MFSQAGMSQHRGPTETEYALLPFERISGSCMCGNHRITECVPEAILSHDSHWAIIHSLPTHPHSPPHPNSPSRAVCVNSETETPIIINLSQASLRKQVY